MNGKQKWYQKIQIKKALERVDKFIGSPEVDDIDNVVWYYAGQIVIVLVAILISSILGLIAFQIMASGGLPALFANIMASACMTTGIPCDYGVTIGVVALSLILITSFVVAFVRIINRDVANFELSVDLDEKQPSRYYNEKQVEVLRFIQALNGTENLSRIANLLNVPYTTARNYVELFERDGYVKIVSNGKGSPVEIEVIKN